MLGFYKLTASHVLRYIKLPRARQTTGQWPLTKLHSLLDCYTSYSGWGLCKLALWSPHFRLFLPFVPHFSFTDSCGKCLRKWNSPNSSTF